jgi:hypothetical protein
MPDVLNELLLPMLFFLVILLYEETKMLYVRYLQVPIISSQTEQDHFYDIMKRGLGLNNEKIQKTFEQWNQSELQSYLIEITAKVLSKGD